MEGQIDIIIRNIKLYLLCKEDRFKNKYVDIYLRMLNDIKNLSYIDLTAEPFVNYKQYKDKDGLELFHIDADKKISLYGMRLADKYHYIDMEGRNIIYLFKYILDNNKDVWIH